MPGPRTRTGGRPARPRGRTRTTAVPPRRRDKDLGIGRCTVREALRALAGAGLVRPRHGSGVFVIATEPAEDRPARLRRAAVTDVHEVRLGVEFLAARLAAQRRTPEDVTALRAALGGRRAASDADDAADAVFVDADITLHAAVVAAARNPVLTALFAEFTPVLREPLLDLLSLTGLREKHPGHGDETHTALVEAVTESAPTTRRRPCARIRKRRSSCCVSGADRARRGPRHPNAPAEE